MRCGFSYDLFMQKLELIEHNSHHKSIRRWDRMLNIFAGKRKRSKINNNFRIFFFFQCKDRVIFKAKPSQHFRYGMYNFITTFPVGTTNFVEELCNSLPDNFACKILHGIYSFTMYCTPRI